MKSVKLIYRSRRFAAFLHLSVVSLLIGLLMQAQSVLAAAILEITPITWNVVGLDSNNVNVGPNTFPIGARVCNKGDAPATNVVANFVWDTANTYINNRPGTSTTLSVASLSNIAPNNCADFYFEVEVTRNSAAYDTTRSYRIAVTADGGLSTSTLIRELYVEHLVSQSRNAITDVQYGTSIGTLTSVAAGGAMTLMVGNTYYIKMTGFTATQGYEQLESFINLPNTTFQLLSVNTTYTADSSATVSSPNNKLYGDSCTWENDPNSPNYRSCLSTGKVGGALEVLYQVKILQVGSTNPQPLSSLIYDFSGSSFHYNADYDVSTRYANIINASLEKSFSPKTITPGSNSTLTFTINNPGSTPISDVNFMDDLPSGMTLANSSVTYSGCGSSPAPASGSLVDPLSFTNITVAGLSNCTITVTVTSSIDGNYPNTTSTLKIGTTDTGDTGTDTLVVSSKPAAPSSCATPVTLATWTMPTSGQGSGGPPPPYTTLASDVSSAITSYVSVSGAQSISTTGNPTNSWGGTAPTSSAGWSETANSSNNYFQFELDTSNYGGVRISLDVSPDNAGNWANPNSNLFIKSSTDGSTFTVYETAPGAYPQAAKNSWTTFSNIPAAATGTSKTWFRISIDSGSKVGATVLLDNISITGCPRPAVPTLAKAFSPTTIAQGSASTLTFTLTNPNASALTGVSFSDVLPGGLLINNPNGLSISCTVGTLTGVTAAANTSTISVSNATLSANTTCTISVSVKGNIAGSYTNTSTNITSAETGPNTSTTPNVGFGQSSLTVIAPPVINKVFTANPLFTTAPGNITALTFSINNPNAAGLPDLIDINFTDTLPSGLVVATPSGLSTTCGNNTATAVAGSNSISLSGVTLPSGASCTVTVNIITGTETGLKTNTVTVNSSNGGTGNTSITDVLVKDKTSSMAFAKYVGLSNTGPWYKSLTLSSLTNVFYSLIVENTGDVPLINVKVEDNKISTTGCSWKNGDREPLTMPFTLPIADADNQHIAICVLGGINAENNVVTNTATVTASNNGLTPITSQATYLPPDSAPNLILAKVGAPSIVGPGTTPYTLTVKNTGNTATSGTITIVDVLPSGLSVTDGAVPSSGTNGANWSCSATSNVITCTSNTSIAAFIGKSIFSFTVTVADTVTNSTTLMNRAQVGGGGDPTNPTPTISTAGQCSAADSPNEGCAVYTHNVTPTYTLLSSFSAYVNDASQTVLEWQTSTELGTIGFLLERLNEKTGKYEVVSDLLPGTLNPPFGGIYRFVDPEAVPGRQYTYRLIEVTATSEGVVAGPYPVTAELPLPALAMSAVGPKGFMLARKVFSRQDTTRFEKRDQAAAQLVAVQKQKTSRTLKLPVRQDGLIYLTAEQLAIASGLKKNQVILLLKSQKILVTLAGKPVPLLATNNGSAFWFYGQAPVRSDIGQNIYRIELGKKGAVMRLAPQSAKKSQVDEPSFAAQVKAEENLRPLHFYNLSKPPQDLWAWDYLFAFGSQPVELARTIVAPHPTGEGPAALTINLVTTGSNGSGTMAPYKVSVLLNGEEVATGESRELGDWQLQAEIPAELLREDGSNEVRIVSSLNTGIAYSLIHLDSIEVEYQRDHQAEKGELVFSGGLQGRATVRGFNSGAVLALDITDLNRPVRLRPLAVQQGDDGTYAVTVPTQQGHRYFITEDLKPQPSALLADTPSKLRDVKNQADWLVIAPAHLLEPAQQLVEHRESQGLVSMAVDIEDVQDEFSWSLPAPEAVHDFLAYVHAQWARAPRYVVLIGDGSIDYQDALGYGLPLVPTELAATPDGLFPSDNALADVVGDDGVPEFALGRIPVFDKAELVHYIDKVITYEQSSRSTTAVVVNDKPDWAAGDFNASADKTVALMPESISAVRIDTGLLGYSAAQAKITAALQQGAGLLHYIGHSSVVRFGNGSGLLSAAGIESMNPTGPPLLMVSMACSSGFFGYPPMNSIGEAALLRADGGAVAFFGATGLSRNYLADILTEGFYRSLADPATERLGDAVVQAKQHYAESQEGAKSHYTLDIYNLLGDPAMDIQAR